MLSIFEFAYDQFDAVLTLRALNSKFKKLADDPYLRSNFKRTKFEPIMCDVRYATDINHLERAIKYCSIINVYNRLNCTIYFEEWN